MCIAMIMNNVYKFNTYIVLRYPSPTNVPVLNVLMLLYPRYLKRKIRFLHKNVLM